MALVVTSLVTILVALLGSAWSVGGRAAMQRRALQQEQAILEKLDPDSYAWHEMNQHIEDRSRIYVARRDVTALSTRKEWLGMAAGGLICAIGFAVQWWADGIEDSYLRGWAVAASLAVLAAGAALLSAMAVWSYRDDAVYKRLALLEELDGYWAADEADDEEADLGEPGGF
jgi:hypothetical protein